MLLFLVFAMMIIIAVFIIVVVLVVVLLFLVIIIVTAVVIIIAMFRRRIAVAAVVVIAIAVVDIGLCLVGTVRTRCTAADLNILNDQIKKARSVLGFSPIHIHRPPLISFSVDLPRKKCTTRLGSTSISIAKDKHQKPGQEP